MNHHPARLFAALGALVLAAVAAAVLLSAGVAATVIRATEPAMLHHRQAAQLTAAASKMTDLPVSAFHLTRVPSRTAFSSPSCATICLIGMREHKGKIGRVDIAWASWKPTDPQGSLARFDLSRQLAEMIALSSPDQSDAMTANTLTTRMLTDTLMDRSYDMSPPPWYSTIEAGQTAARILDTWSKAQR